MANIQERRNKDGKLISFSIRVHRGRGADGKQLKPYTATFEVQPSWREETARKKAAAFAAVFEKECKEGVRADTRQTFAAYCDYVIDLKENRSIKHKTAFEYRKMTKRIYPQIGHIKLKDLRVDHLNEFYSYLSSDGMNMRTGGKLSNKTIVEYHRLISTVLEQAVKEGLIPFNPAHRAEPPKVVQKEVNYFQPNQVKEIREALEHEPLKWKVFVHLLLITGARRGELIGLKWDKVSFENNQLYICNNVIYTSDRGVYEDSPKTERSKRFISIPAETTALLKQYRARQAQERLKLGAYFNDQNYVFAQDNGDPIHPDSVPDYLKKFSKRYNLPHINAHAFRHTMASMLYFNGIDSVSISKRLGHAQVSTTANIYAHVIEEADKKNADIISNVFLKNA